MKVCVVVRAVLVFLLLVRLGAGQEPHCPSFYGQTGDPEDLTLSSINLFLDPQQLPELPSRLYLIEEGVVFSFVASLATISNPAVLAIVAMGLPEGLTSFPLQLSAGPDTLYYSLSVTSVEEEEEGVVSTVCPSPRIGNVTAETQQNIDLSFSCSSSGTAIIHTCLTVGTQPISALNGTYHTFTMFLPLACSGPTPAVADCATPTRPPLLAEMCITANQSIALVQAGEGSWPLLANVLRPGSVQSREGYCVIDDRAVPPGLISLLRDDDVNIRYAYPASFVSLDMYFKWSGHLRPPVPLTFSIMPESRDRTIVEDPRPTNGAPLTGIALDGTVEYTFDLTCKQPGLTQVFINFNVSAVVDDVLVEDTYPQFYFYRNCTSANASVVVITNNLGLEVGVSLAVIFVLVVGVVITVVVVMVLLTRHNHAQAYKLEQEFNLQQMASSNAYMMAEIEGEMESLKKLSVEYNYASLEMVEELGEGAFGRVFKAIAPGILDPGGEGGKGLEDFVAVKTLKEGADSDSMAAFVAEVKTSAQFKHRNVIRLLGVCTDTPHKCMIFEFMDWGSLSDILRQSDPSSPTHDPSAARLQPQHFLSCCMQVAQGLAYLATLKFVHRDVATRNCLIDSNLLVKIADFGLSREVCASDYYRVGGTSACLPVRWMPPEALLYGKFTVKSDVWSFGVLMWEVYAYAQQPYGGMSNYEVIDRIKDGQVLPCPELSPASVYDIMKSCWTRVPQRRPTIASLVTRIGHLLRSNSLTILDDYTTMGQAEGYFNLGFGTVAGEEELQEKARVDAIIEEHTRQQERIRREMELTEASRGEDSLHGEQGEGEKEGELQGEEAVVSEDQVRGEKMVGAGTVSDEQDRERTIEGSEEGEDVPLVRGSHEEDQLEEVPVVNETEPVRWKETKTIVRVYSVEMLPSVTEENHKKEDNTECNGVSEHAGLDVVLINTSHDDSRGNKEGKLKHIL